MRLSSGSGSKIGVSGVGSSGRGIESNFVRGAASVFSLGISYGAASGALGRALVLYCVFGVFLLAGRKHCVFCVFEPDFCGFTT